MAGHGHAVARAAVAVAVAFQEMLDEQVQTFPLCVQALGRGAEDVMVMLDLKPLLLIEIAPQILVRLYPAAGIKRREADGERFGGSAGIGGVGRWGHGAPLSFAPHHLD